MMEKINLYEAQTNVSIHIMYNHQITSKTIGY